MIHEDISNLILEFYRGVDRPERWDAAIAQICSRFSAKWVLVAPFDELGKHPFDQSFHQVPNSRFLDGMQAYATHHWQHDPTNRFAAANPNGGIFDSRAITCPERYREHAYVRWNRNWLSSSFWQLHYTGRERHCFGFSLHRDEAHGPLEVEETRLLAMLTDHMAEAARLAARPPDLSGPEAVIVLGQRGEFMGCSASADTILRRADGLKCRNGRLHATDRASAIALDRAMATLLGEQATRATASVLLRRFGADLLAVLSILPVGAQRAGIARPALLMRLLDRDAPPILRWQADWEALFQFTPAERRLAAALLVEESGLRATAETLGISYATARVQLASLFEKSGTNSQAALIKLLIRLG